LYTFGPLRQLTARLAAVTGAGLHASARCDNLHDSWHREIDVQSCSEAGPDQLIMPVDGRQSQAALAIRRGVCRRLRAEGFALIPELKLPSGRRADLVGLGQKAEILIIEIKSSIEDYRSDGKWPEYLIHADRFYFATGPSVPVDIFPQTTGLMIADSYGADIIRPAAEDRLHASVRKTMLVRIARAGALRLHDLEDPEAANAVS
jgi:hypothetical protein